MAGEPKAILISPEQIKEAAKDLLFGLTNSRDYSPEHDMPESAALRQAEIAVEKWLRYMIFDKFMNHDIDYWMCGVGSTVLGNSIRVSFDIEELHECDVEGCVQKPIKGEIVCQKHSGNFQKSAA